jgi:FtsP/CotA-like multicopper oxidase with cupredoxin domain
VILLLAACHRPPDGSNVPHDPWLDPEPAALADENDDPSVFEATITASATTWPLSPERDVAGLAYNGTVPGPLIRVALGTEVVLHFENDLPAVSTRRSTGTASKATTHPTGRP